MKKIAIITALIVTLTTQLSASAFDWGNFLRWFLWGSSNQKTYTTADMKTTLSDIKTQKATYDKSVKDIFLSNVSLLSSPKDYSKVQSDVNAIFADKTLTDIEKDTKFLEVMNSYTTTLKNNKVATVLLIKTLSDSSKTTLKSNISTLSKYPEMYSDLKTKGSDIVASVATAADTEQENILKELTQLTSDLKTKASAVGSFSTQVSLFARIAGIEL